MTMNYFDEFINQILNKEGMNDNVLNNIPDESCKNSKITYNNQHSTDSMIIPQVLQIDQNTQAFTE